MRILGNGFMARNFERIGGAHPSAFVFAAGVSDSRRAEDAEFRREVELLYDSVRRCLADSLTLLYLSSSGLVYGDYPAETREDGPLFPVSAYGRHKLALEAVIRQSGVGYLILRISNPVGLYQKPHQLVPALYAQMQRGQVQVWRGAHRDLIDVDDVVSIADRLLAMRIGSEVFNVGSGLAVPVEDIVSHLESRFSTYIRKTYVDRPDSHRVCVDKLRRALGPAGTVAVDGEYYKRVIDKYYPPPTPRCG